MQIEPNSRRSLVLCLAAACLLAACGKKGDPEPPLSRIPAAAQDLAVQQQGDDLRFEVGYPTVATSGLSLPELDVVEFLRLVRPAPTEGDPQVPQVREFQGMAEPFLTLRGADLAAAIAGDRIAIALPLGSQASSTPQALTFGVRFTTVEGETSSISNLATVVPRTPPASPTDLRLTARAGGVEVQWAAPDGTIGSYNVYRREAAEKSYGQPLGNPGADERTYLDGTAEFGKRYIYSVTAVAEGDAASESSRGAEREIDYQDRFPPNAPESLVALVETDRIRLRWEASSDRDVAGYLLYRGEGDGAPQRLTARPLTETLYLDERVRAGVTYRYRVTAVDALGNESPTGAETSAALR